MSAVIVWFRRDLRLLDHPALTAASRLGLPVIALYLHSPEEEGDWRPGAASNWWLHHSLCALDAELRKLGGRLIVRRGPALEAIRRLIAETGASAVHWNRLYEPALIARDREIKRRLRADGITVESHNATLWIEPWEVRTQSGQPFRVFTPFWRRASPLILDRAPLPIPHAIHFGDAGLESESIASLRLLPRIAWDSGLARTWTPGEQGALIKRARSTRSRRYLDAFPAPAFR